ncbi:MAG: hypothetical protein U1F43_15990 [Myxococcota bacterium]
MTDTVRRLALLFSLVFALHGTAFAQDPDADAVDEDATAAPTEGDDAVAPPEGEDTAAAPEGEDATAPTEGEDAVAPHEGDDAAAPAEGEDAAAPSEGEDAAAPSEGDDAGAVLAPAPAPDENGGGAESIKGEPPPGDAPAVGEHEVPHGDASFDELMPDEKDLAPSDEDGDGQVEPEEVPIKFAVGPYVTGYAAKLKGLIESLRGKIIDKMLLKTNKKQAKAMNLVMLIMLGLSGAGFLLLLVPLFLKKKYPGREKLLWKGAMLATGAWISTMLVFTGAMFLLRTAKNETAKLTSPPLAVANAAFDAAKDEVDFLAEDAPVILEAPIAKLASGQSDGLLESVLENVSQFRNDLGVFKALADFFKSLNWLFAAFGTILVVLAVVMFMSSQRQVLGDILRLPGRAAAGDPGSFAAIYADMQKRTLREVLALMLTIGVLVIAAIFAGVVLYVAVGPAVAAIFDYLIFNIYYILGAESASKLVVYVSLFGIGIFLGLVILFVLLANAFFLGKMQKVLQQKFRHQLPSANYKKFFLWGPIAAVWVQVLPVIFIFIAGIVVDAVVSVRHDEAVSWGALLLTGPVAMVVGLPLFVWLAQGFRALKFLRKFDHLQGSPEKKAPKVAEVAKAAA